MNPYEILGVDKNTPLDDIKKAYRKKVKDNHPDHGHDPKILQQINEAYDKIKNGETEPSIDDYFNRNFTDIFGGNSNIYTNINVPLSYMFFGASIDVTLYQLGIVGFGNSIVNLVIPPNCPVNYSINHKVGKTTVVIRLNFTEENGYIPHGNNIYKRVSIDVLDVIRGKKLELVLPCGRYIAVTIPFPIGKMIRLPKMGLIGNNRGDLILETDITVGNLTDDQINAIREIIK